MCLAPDTVKVYRRKTCREGHNYSPSVNQRKVVVASSNSGKYVVQLVTLQCCVCGGGCILISWIGNQISKNSEWVACLMEFMTF